MDDSINYLPVCSAEGKKCFEEKSKSYNEDLIDRTECDCKNDCEMVHTFSTLQVNRNIINEMSNLVMSIFEELRNFLNLQYVFFIIARAILYKCC